MDVLGAVDRLEKNIGSVNAALAQTNAKLDLLLVELQRIASVMERIAGPR